MDLIALTMIPRVGKKFNRDFFNKCFHYAINRQLFDLHLINIAVGHMKDIYIDHLQHINLNDWSEIEMLPEIGLVTREMVEKYSQVYVQEAAEARQRAAETEKRLVQAVNALLTDGKTSGEIMSMIDVDMSWLKKNFPDAK